jgi:hypothetical protein
MDMEQSPSQQRLAEYMHNLAQLHKDISEQRISHEKAVRRLTELKLEHKKLEESGIFPLSMQVPVDEAPTRKKTNPKISHALNFSCACRRCTRLSTITMQDRTLLKSMGIVWRSKAEDESVNDC